MGGKIHHRLEEHLNTTLLIRSTRSLHLTEAGYECYRSAGKIGEELTLLEDRMRDRTAEISGSVRISIPAILASSKMGKIASDFQDLYPKIKLDVSVSDRFIDVINDDFDLVLRITSSLDDSDLMVRKIADIPRILCASPKYLAEAPAINSPKTLPDHKCLVYGRLPSSSVWQLKENGKTLNIIPNAHMYINNSYMIKSALVAGAGIAFLPRLVVEDELISGEVVAVTNARDASPMQLFLLRAAIKHVPARVRALADYLVDVL